MAVRFRQASRFGAHTAEIESASVVFSEPVIQITDANACG